MKNIYLISILLFLLVGCSLEDHKINYDSKRRISSVIKANEYDSLVWVYDTLGFLHTHYIYESGKPIRIIRVEHTIVTPNGTLSRIMWRDFYGTTEINSKLTREEILDTSECKEDVVYKFDSITQFYYIVSRKKENGNYSIVRTDSIRNIEFNPFLISKYLYAKDWQ